MKATKTATKSAAKKTAAEKLATKASKLTKAAKTGGKGGSFAETLAETKKVIAKKPAKPTAQERKEADIAAKLAKNATPAAKATNAAKAKQAAKKAAPVAPGLTTEQRDKLRELEELAIEKGDIVSKPTGYEKGTENFPIMIIRKSVQTNPVQVSWDMFDMLRKASVESGIPMRRKDAIAYAVENGIAFYTARTQYQSWKTANKF